MFLLNRVWLVFERYAFIELKTSLMLIFLALSVKQGALVCNLISYSGHVRVNIISLHVTFRNLGNFVCDTAAGFVVNKLL